MVQNKVQHSGQHLALADPRAQFLGHHAGQRQQAVGVILVGQNPAQRRKRQRLGILPLLIGVAQNCLSPDVASRGGQA